MRASFSVAWKNPRAKVLYTAGERAVKPAAVKLARIMCIDAVANMLVCFFCQITPSSDTFKISQSIFCNKLLLLRSENFILELDETTDLGNDAQFMVFMRYRATEDYVELLLFCRPLAKHTTGKEMFKKVDFFIKEHQLSRTHCVSVCADSSSAMMRTKKVL